MGGWKLEIGRMALYMAFPVGMFYLFNQPQYFEEHVVSKKKIEFERSKGSHDKVCLIL